MVGMSRGDMTFRRRNFGNQCVHSWYSYLAAFPNFNLFVFRFFYWICVFQHFIIWIPLQIRNGQGEITCRVDTVGGFFNMIFYNGSKIRCLGIWPSLLCMNSRHHCLFFCPAWQMCSFFPTCLWDTSSPCSHVSTSYSPINIIKLLKIKHQCVKQYLHIPCPS